MATSVFMFMLLYLKSGFNSLLTALEKMHVSGLPSILGTQFHGFYSNIFPISEDGGVKCPS